MKLSEETLDIVENFCTINKGVLVRPGAPLRTVSPQRNIVAEAVIPESFPVEFGIYDLGELLQVLSLFKEAPEIEFQDKQLVIAGQSGRSKTTYRYTAPELIVTLPGDKKFDLPTEDIKFTLSAEDLAWVQKTAAVLKLPQVVIESDGDKVNITALDVQNDAAHTNSLELGEGDGSVYKVIFNTENLKLLPGQYEVAITASGDKKFARFYNPTRLLTYYVTSEQGTTFSKE